MRVHGWHVLHHPCIGPDFSLAHARSEQPSRHRVAVAIKCMSLVLLEPALPLYMCPCIIKVYLRHQDLDCIRVSLWYIANPLSLIPFCWRHS